MAQVRIPLAHRPLLVRLAHLPPSESAKLIDGLASVTEPATTSALAAVIRDSFAGISVEEASDLGELLIALVGQGRFHGWTIDEFVPRIGRSTDLELDDESRENLGQLLSRLLKLEPILRTGKALDVITDTAAVFHTARVLTDIRPVFGDEPGLGPLGAVLIHFLKIEAYVNGRIETSFVSLTVDELEELKSAIDRATAKTATLRSFMASSGLRELEVETERE